MRAMVARVAKNYLCFFILAYYSRCYFIVEKILAELLFSDGQYMVNHFRMLYIAILHFKYIDPSVFKWSTIL